MSSSKPTKSLSPTIAYGFLGLVGVSALLLGFVNLRRTISDPARLTEKSRQEIVSQADLAELANQERLKTQDIDQDGLTDYEELNIYGTSPYLADSDSDGFSDKQEIDSGNDPNCPVGTNCRTAQIEVPEESEVIGGFEEFGGMLDQQTANNLQQAADSTDSAGSPQAGQEIDLTNLAPEQIRELLLQSGQITQEQLGQIDDETLMEVYNEALGETSN